MVYAYTRNVGRAEDRLERLGLTLHLPFGDPDSPGFVFVFVEAIDIEESESEEEDDLYCHRTLQYDSCEEVLEEYYRRRRRADSDSDDNLSAALSALQVRDHEYEFYREQPAYIVHEHHYHVDNTQSNTHYEETHYHGKPRRSAKEQALVSCHDI